MDAEEQRRVRSRCDEVQCGGEGEVWEVGMDGMGGWMGGWMDGWVRYVMFVYAHELLLAM